MGCSYWINPIRIPQNAIDKVKVLQSAHGLEEDWPFSIITEEDKAMLIMEDSNMSYSTACEVDAFLDDLAELLADTPQDGQHVKYDHELGETVGYHIFINGQRHEIACGLIIVKAESVEAGKTQRIKVEVEVLGLPDGRAAIISA